MKYLKIDLFQPPGEKIRYPNDYQAHIGNYAIDHLYYDEGMDLKLILVIPNKNFKQAMIRESVVEITEVEVRQISESSEVRTEEVNDEAMVRRIEIKIKQGKSLTPKEEKAIDPDDDTPGFTKTKILADRIEKKKDEIPNL